MAYGFHHLMEDHRHRSRGDFGVNPDVLDGRGSCVRRKAPSATRVVGQCVSHVCAAGGQKGMRGASRASRNRAAKTSLDEFKINRRKEESEMLRKLCGETDEIGETRASWPR
mmetsp:Transcript_49444/g.159112  ORF Transcript_49444/g.159112 Transcript_49444/m.159112 type:complete len:112 (+) Transcript_49444:3-338(+)